MPRVQVRHNLHNTEEEISEASTLYFSPSVLLEISNGTVDTTGVKPFIAEANKLPAVAFEIEPAKAIQRAYLPKSDGSSLTCEVEFPTSIRVYKDGSLRVKAHPASPLLLKRKTSLWFTPSTIGDITGLYTFTEAEVVPVQGGKSVVKASPAEVEVLVRGGALAMKVSLGKSWAGPGEVVVYYGAKDEL